MEIFAYKELHWILKLTFEERQEIMRIAKILKIRPSLLIRDMITHELEHYKQTLE